MTFQSAWLAACLPLSLVSSLPPATGEDPPPEIRWESYSATGHDGSPLAGDLGRIEVPERRGSDTGKTIEIAFVVYRTENPDPAPPVFFLIGGPGGPGVEYTALTATHRLFRLLDHCDVIGIDQRGTGHSVPNLSDGPDFAYQLPLDRAIEREDVVRAQRKAMQECHAYWSAKGVDLEAYNTAESADDVDDVRRALGLEKVTLWGSSYGSHLGLAYLRRHPQGAARAILSKVEGPDHTVKLPSAVQRQLRSVHERIAGDEAAGQIPDLLALVRELLESFAQEPRRATVRGEDGESQVTIGAYDLQRAIANRLADTRGHVFLPAFLQEILLGNLDELAQDALEHRRGDMQSAMAMMMECSSAMSAERAEVYGRERRDPQYLLGDALVAPLYPEACAGCGDPDLGPAFREPIECDVPVLFVSGSLDARTPPSNVDEIRSGFPRSVHVVVENTGHDSRELLSPEYQALLTAFIKGEPAQDARIELRWDRFAPVRGE